MRPLFVIFAPLFLLASCVSDSSSSSDDESSEVALVGTRVPIINISVVSPVDDSVSQFSTADPQACLLVFFNTGCTDCQRELPVINAWYERHRDEPDCPAVVCIAREEQQESIRRFWQDRQLSLPFSPQPDRSVYNRFATLTIPRVYHVNADGIITHIDIERLNAADWQ